jgi:hypothetical protein
MERRITARHIRLGTQLSEHMAISKVDQHVVTVLEYLFRVRVVQQTANKWLWVHKFRKAPKHRIVYS